MPLGRFLHRGVPEGIFFHDGFPLSYGGVIRALSSPIRPPVLFPGSCPDWKRLASRLAGKISRQRSHTNRSNKPTALIGALLDVIWLAAKFADGDRNTRRRDDGLLYTVDSQRGTI